MSFIELLISLIISSIGLILLLGGFAHREHLLQRALLQDTAYRLFNNAYECTTRKQLGISLVEIMLVLAISSFVSLGLIHAYLLSQSQHTTLSTQITESFDLAWVEQLIRDRIRRAGFTPCVSINHLRTHDPLESYHIQLTPEAALHLYRMDDEFFNVVSTDAHHLQLDKPHRFQTDSVYLIADCYHAELIQPIKSIDNVWEIGSTLRFHYETQAYVGLWLHEAFIWHSKSLMYVYMHPEKLMDDVLQFSSAIKPVPGKVLLQVKLLLHSGKKLNIETAMRNV